MNGPILYTRHKATCATLTKPFIENHPCDCGLDRGPFRLVGWRAEFEWKPQDLWIGAYWKRVGHCVDLWVCFVPCVPLHVSWWWTREPL